MNSRIIPRLLVLGLIVSSFGWALMGPAAQAQSSHVPQWSQEAVWYQIFPERFRNADTTNDPTAERINAPDGWEISPWTGDWYQRAQWEQRTGPTFRDFVFDRRYGGDLQGVINKLDYIENLGVTAIYFNPVFDAVTLHKYDASYYHHIDRFFGPNPEKDTRMMKREDPGDPSTWKWTTADSLFLKLIEEAHKRDLKVVIDGVFNHTGQDFWAFRDLQANQRDSDYKEWYDVISFDDPATPDTNEFDFHGWWGYKGLPEFQEKDGTLIKPVREHIFDITRRWMDPNGDGDPSDGVDGWRLDVAEEVGKKFWRQWHELVREINPDAYTVAEIWTPNAVNYVNEEMFTASMNYRFAYPVMDFMIDREISAAQFDDSLRAVRDDYSWDVNLAMQNLMAGHDTPRLASMVVNPGREYDRQGSPADGFKVRKPNRQEREVQKLIALFQFTYVGSPMYFYGTETGMWGADDPHDRKPMVWDDMEYKDEINHPFGKERPRDEVAFNEELHSWYRQLAGIRNANEVLQTGRIETLVAPEGRDVYAFARYKEELKPAVIILNREDSKQTVSIEGDLPGAVVSSFKDRISGREFKVNDSQSFEVALPARSGVILLGR